MSGGQFSGLSYVDLDLDFSLASVSSDSGNESAAVITAYSSDTLFLPSTFLSGSELQSFELDADASWQWL